MSEKIKKKRRFNVTGACVKHKHYMVDTTSKINEMIRLIEADYYFAINRPRQYGKTTSLEILENTLSPYYLILQIDLQDFSTDAYKSEKDFIATFRESLEEIQEYLENERLDSFINDLKSVVNIKGFGRSITRFTKNIDVVLILDESDSGTNNEIFLDFLSMLRKKYLGRTVGKGSTFKSVILTGVHDIRNLKDKMPQNNDKKENSPWNIAEEFRVDMSFNVNEIETMLEDYLTENPDVEMNLSAIASRIHYFTNGYPFFVSYLCKLMDESFHGSDKWNLRNLEKAVNMLLERETTNFESLIQNLENHEELYKLVRQILIDGADLPFGDSAPARKKGLMYGILKKSDENKLAIYNPILEFKIFQYLSEKMDTEKNTLSNFPSASRYINANKTINMPLALTNYSKYLFELRDDKTDEFVENNARLLFSIFMKPIINSVGFMYKEPVISDRKRLDVLIIYHETKYVIELKIWRGQAYYDEAKEQLADYLEREGLAQGYMVIHDFRKQNHQRGEVEQVFVDDKVIDVYFV